MAHFLLLHGACHGGWCWDAVASILGAAGHETTAPDLPCENLNAGLTESADAAVTATRGTDEELVVVGHSLGALLAPLVAHRVPTRRMVMVAGVIGAPGMSLESLATQDADRDAPLQDTDLEFDPEGRFCFTDAGARRVLYHDCPPQLADASIARLRFQRSMWREVADFDAWPQVETMSIVCAEDRVVNPSWSRRVARDRLGVEPIDLHGGHSPFLARPAALADILMDGL